MKDKILVVGGYGQVGQVICSRLGNLFPGKVIAAGRSFEKARQFASTTDGKVIPLQMNVNAIQSFDFIEDVSLVVMCLDQENTRFIEQCLDQKIHYIDITASYDFLSKVRNLGNKEKPLQSVSVLSVGVAPGLTNMLVKQSAMDLDDVRSVDIFLMVGLGEQHGRAAIEWMVDNVNEVFYVVEDGMKKQVKSFEEGKKAEFPGIIGRRMAYRFNFPDQHTLVDTLNIPTISTRICFESAVITNLVALMKRLGVFRSLQYHTFRQFMVNLFLKFHWGSEIVVAKASAIGLKNDRTVRYECSIVGQKESYITGIVASFVARNVYLKEYPSGVFHMEELFHPLELIDDLGGLITFDKRVSVPSGRYMWHAW